MDLKNKQILVTGADGFIGSHLVEELIKRGYLVKAFVMYNSFNSWGWLDSFKKDTLAKIEVVAGDIRDGNFVNNAMKGIDIVFHLAALITIPFSYQSPENYIDTKGQPYPYIDLIMRSSGEQRTSGFLLWQAEYAEYYWESTRMKTRGV